MSPMNLTPRDKRPSDRLSDFPESSDNLFRRKCKLRGCSGTVDPKTGKCVVCGMMHGTLPEPTTEQPKSRTLPPRGHTASASYLKEALPRQSSRVYKKGTPPQPAQHAAITKIEQAYPPRTSQPCTTSFKSAPMWETPYRRPSLHLPKFSLDEKTRWWLIRGAVILIILLAASLPAILHYLNRSSLTETVLPSSNSNPSSPAIPPPTTAYTVSISVATQGGRIRISDSGSEKICEPGSPFTEQYKPGTKIAVMAIPDDGWKFQRWDGYASSLNFLEINITKPVTISAHFEDIAPPKILDFGISKVTEICAYIFWKTAEPITMYEIRYGKSLECELSGPSGEHNGTDGSAKIIGLEPDTSYFYKITLKDASGIKTTSETRKFTTISPLPAQVGNRAPDFALPKLGDNSLINLSDFQGKKVLLNLWATNCPGCVLELPYIQAIHETCEDVAVITVCLDKNVENILNFRDKHPEITFLILINQPSIIGDYPIRVMPTTFFIDRDGVIRTINAGLLRSPEEIKAILDSIE